MDEYRFLPKHFDEMLINPYEIGADVNLYEHFQDAFKTLGKDNEIFKDFKGKYGKLKIDNNKVIRFLAYYCDPSTPIRSGIITDEQKQIEVAGNLAGFDNDAKGKFISDYQEVLNFNPDIINNMTICFLRIFKEPLWTLIVTQTIYLYTEVFPMQKKAASDVKEMEKAIMNVGKISLMIADATKEFLSQKNARLQKRVYYAVEKELAELDTLRPEHYAVPENWDKL